MKLLLDTHVWLWMLSTPERLNEGVQEALANPDVELWLSVASAWEVAIKHARGKLPLPSTIEELLDVSVHRLDVRVMVIGLQHALEAARLPPHHNDPFDRLLIAQAKLEGMTLVSADALVQQYGGRLLWAV